MWGRKGKGWNEKTKMKQKTTNQKTQHPSDEQNILDYVNSNSFCEF